MMIKTKSVYDSKSRGDGKRILITRHYPRFHKKLDYDEWYRLLAPSRGLLNSYRSKDITWKQFRLAFLKELSAEEAKEEIDKLAKLGRNRNVTLLCYEREGERCHRHIVRALIAKKTRSQGMPLE
ncbi:MAG: DUF488 domain-containing protein [Nitrososphaerales archaeon]